MALIKKRKILGRTKDNTGVPIKGAKVIPANQDIIAEANAELRKKCAKQRYNDAEAALAAREMWVGSYDDKTVGSHFDTPQEEQTIYGGPTLTKKRR